MDDKTRQSKTTETSAAREEMCAQFTKIFPQQLHGYWGEKALLNVLLKREGELSAALTLPEDAPGGSAKDDHVRRRIMIFMLLGLRSAAAEIMLENNDDPNNPSREQNVSVTTGRKMNALNQSI